MTTFRPLLAASLASEADLGRLNFPMIASPKIDGIRIVCHPEYGPVTRSMKPLPNEHIRTVLSKPTFSGLDGEIVVGENHGPGVFERTTGAIRSSGGIPNFSYWVFDSINYPTAAYAERLDTVTERFTDPVFGPNARIIALEFCLVHNASDVLTYENDCVMKGYEGIMLRSPHAPYKFNRSTFREQTLIKVKRFKDDEAVIVGFEPLERNTNERRLNELGLSERSSHRSGRVQDNLLGTLRVTNPTFGEFGIGSGFDVGLRETIWRNQDRYLGKAITFKYQEVGTQDKPRFPIFLRFREHE